MTTDTSGRAASVLPAGVSAAEGRPGASAVTASSQDVTPGSARADQVFEPDRRRPVQPSAGVLDLADEGALPGPARPAEDRRPIGLGLGRGPGPPHAVVIAAQVARGHALGRDAVAHAGPGHPPSGRALGHQVFEDLRLLADDDAPSPEAETRVVEVPTLRREAEGVVR